MSERNDPFAALGVPARADLPDEEVRAAWKRIAAATHPDREDGGDAARYASAAAAYDTLRTSFGRGEALADLGLAGAGARAARYRTPFRPRARHARRGERRGRRVGLGAGVGVGGPRRRLAIRAATAVAVTVAAVLAAGWTPATVGVLVGALTWAVVASRHDWTRRGDWLADRASHHGGYFEPSEGPFVSPILGAVTGAARARGPARSWLGWLVIRGTDRWRWGGWDR